MYALKIRRKIALKDRNRNTLVKILNFNFQVVKKETARQEGTGAAVLTGSGELVRSKSTFKLCQGIILHSKFRQNSWALYITCFSGMKSFHGASTVLFPSGDAHLVIC
jgi:hypothetical protein